MGSGPEFQTSNQACYNIVEQIVIIMTLIVMTLIIMTLIIMTLIIMKLIIMTLAVTALKLLVTVIVIVVTTEQAKKLWTWEPSVTLLQCTSSLIELKRYCLQGHAVTSIEHIK